MPIAARRVKQHSGFTLLEVLVALLILSTGILAVIKMEFIAIKTARQSDYASTALALALDLSNKMHGNPEQIRHAAASPFLKINFKASEDQIKAPTLCFSRSCSPEQLAAADITEWLRNVSASLPNAHALVCIDSAPWDDEQNSLTWECHAANGTTSIVIKLGWSDQAALFDDHRPLLALPSIPYVE